MGAPHALRTAPGLRSTAPRRAVPVVREVGEVGEVREVRAVRAVIVSAGLLRVQLRALLRWLSAAGLTRTQDPGAATLT